MTIDLSQFHHVFFEESFENLDIMESSLMDLDIGAVDGEVINAIFRAAHSIKGGSATFGFSAIADFTHILETLLDQVRSGQRAVSTEDVNLFLKSVDAIREMLGMLQSGEDATTRLSEELSTRFNEILEGKTQVDPVIVESSSSVTASTDATQECSEITEGDHWQILFIADSNIYRSGNDPLRLIRELGKLGNMFCETKVEKLPTLNSMDAETNYLSWKITLQSDTERSNIEEIFEWIVDESDINIERVKAADNSSVVDADKTYEDEIFWSIEFIPQPHLLRTGNDPVKLFQSMMEFGEIKSVKVESLPPSISSIDPEACYLSWQILFASKNADKSKIESIFEWVLDESTVTIKSVSGLYDRPNQQITTNQSPANEPQSSVVKTPKVAAKSPAKKTTVKSASKSSAAEGSSIRVGIDKVDNLINMVGELVITQSMLGQLGTEFDVERLPKLLEGLGQLEQNTRELQESVMRIRMLPISFVFSRFPRMVRDLSQSLNKVVQLDIHGDQTELDKTVMEKIGDPLVHLVRNAVDHGIEDAKERKEKGKSEQGTVTLEAYHQGGNVVIKVVDDGKGLDPESLKQKALDKDIIKPSEAELLTREQAFDLIFQPGFSTAKNISDVSGRGVGMDVVKRNIQALNGAVEISSELDVGSTITIRLPLTLAILDGQLVRVADQTFIFPLVSIIESLQCKSEFINNVAGGCDVFKLRDEYVPIIHLAKAFNVPMDEQNPEASLMVVVESEGEKVGIVVNELLAQQQVVIKSLEQNYKRVNGISGATILGDGTVALIVDIPGIVRLAGSEKPAIQELTKGLIAQNQDQAAQQARL